MRNRQIRLNCLAGYMLAVALGVLSFAENRVDLVLDLFLDRRNKLYLNDLVSFFRRQWSEVDSNSMTVY